MAYPKPIPAFTPEAYRRALNRIEESTIPEDEKEAVEEIRAEMKSNNERP